MTDMRRGLWKKGEGFPARQVQRLWRLFQWSLCSFLSVSLIVILFAPFDSFVLLSFWSFCSSFGHFFLVVCNLFGRFCVACVGHQWPSSLDFRTFFATCEKVPNYRRDTSLQDSLCLFSLVMARNTRFKAIVTLQLMLKINDHLTFPI